MADTTRDIVLRLEGSVNTFQARVDAQFTGLNSKVGDLLDCYSDLHETVHGNGKPGLKDDVKDIRADVLVLKQRHAKEDIKTEQIKTERRAFSWKVAFALVEKVIYIAGIVVAILLGIKQ